MFRTFTQISLLLAASRVFWSRRPSRRRHRRRGGARPTGCGDPARDAPARGRQLLRRDRRRRPRRADARSAHAGGDGEVLRVFADPVRRGAVVLSIPDGRVLAHGRAARPPTRGRRRASWRCTRGRRRRRSSRSSRRRRWSRRAALTAATPHLLPRRRLVDPARQPRRHPVIDGRCDTLAYGIGKSQNAILAKLASRHLTTDSLAARAPRFGFGEALPFELPVEPSHLDVPGRPARVRAHGGRLLALDAVAHARRAAGGDDRRTRASCRRRRCVEPRRRARTARPLATAASTAPAPRRERRRPPARSAG